MILVFKTTVNNPKDVQFLGSQMNEIVQIDQWNFDLDDVDNVLRIESSLDVSSQLTNLFENNGFHCEDLDPSV